VSKQKQTPINSPVSLLILEGDTESVFYPIVRDHFLKGIKIHLCQVNQGSNINKQILSKIFIYIYNNPNDLIRVYCCTDTDRNKNSPTPFDIPLIENEIKKKQEMRSVLSVNSILADPEIESWFFYDIDSIYKSLRADKSKRNHEKYKNNKSLGKRELKKLFEQFGQIYLPGKKSTHFISQLDIGKIVNKCKELQEGISLIKSQATDLTNYLWENH